MDRKRTLICVGPYWRALSDRNAFHWVCPFVIILPIIAALFLPCLPATVIFKSAAVLEECESGQHLHLTEYLDDGKLLIEKEMLAHWL